jgi:hypothetical protein
MLLAVAAAALLLVLSNSSSSSSSSGDTSAHYKRILVLVELVSCCELLSCGASCKCSCGSIHTDGKLC